MKNFPLETVKAVKEFYEAIDNRNEAPDEKKSQNYYEALAKHVKIERERIGGQNWVLSQAVSSRKYREAMKKILGPNCYFITLGLSSGTQNQRLQNRYKHLQEDQRNKVLEFLTDVEKNFEPAALDEKNGKHIVVTPDLDQKAVVQKILDTIKSFE